MTAALWIGGPLIQKLPGFGAWNDTTTALLAGLVLCVVQNGTREGGGLLIGADLRRVPWDVLMLFGGGLALAEAIQGSGLSEYLGILLAGIGTLPLVALIATMVALLVFWTEFNSNVATAATFMPILAAIAAASDYPVLQLVAPAAIAASCGFMLPVGTPPNAIVFGTGPAHDAGNDPLRLAREPRRDRHRDRGLDDRDPADRLSGYFSFVFARIRPLARSRSQR